MDLPPKGYKRNLVLIAYTLAATLSVYVLIKHLLSPLLPFMIAYTVALFLRPKIEAVSRRTHLSRRLAAFATVGFLYTLIFALCFIFFSKMASELTAMASDMTDGGADFIEHLLGEGGGVMKRLPILSKIESKEALDIIRRATVNMLEGALTSFSAKIPDAIMSFVSSLPGILLFLLTLVVSSFYLGADVSSVNCFIAGLLPTEERARLLKIKEGLMRAAKKYIRAYAIILAITFAQLFIGFIVLDIPYALTLSALIALIDILPVLGVGTVLLPWAAVLYLMGNSYTATGLLIIFAIIWLVRQISEPKIVGDSIGISPLITLAAMYIGFKLMGFSGLFVFPIGAVIVKSVLDAVRDGAR